MASVGVSSIPILIADSLVLQVINQQIYSAASKFFQKRML